jgi:hypothetical protein
MERLMTTYDEEDNLVGIKKYYPSGPSEPEPPQELDKTVQVTPSFELGASSSDPSVGSGVVEAEYYIKEFENRRKVDLTIFIQSRAGTSGVGTGSYELYLPDEIEPSEDKYSGHANIWISGGGISEFDGSVKWTMRNTLKGPKLIFTFDGTEWGPTHPKNYADFKLRASIEYYL